MRLNNITKKKKLFIRFLKETNCYQKFIYNLENHEITNEYRTNDIDELIDSINPFEKYLNEVMLAFKWGLTNEGDSYWGNIFFKWTDLTLSIYKNNKQNLIIK